MKFLFNHSLLLCLTCALLFSSCSANAQKESGNYPPSAKGITDLALIYCADQSRPEWTSENLAPYVYRENEGKLEWLFDGFLFVEIYMASNGVNYDFGIPFIEDVIGRELAGKSEWELLINKIFEDGKSPNALETVLTNLAKDGHVVPWKRQVMIGIPNPAWGGSWGELDGKTLNFWDNDDRLAAVKWYIDRVEEEWKRRDYKYIELAGFYWTNESLIVGYADDVIVKKVQEETESRGYDFSWVPYNGAGGVAEWNEYGFTVAYQQPNYFFDDVIVPEKMAKAIDTAKKYNMAMEMEFDDRIGDSEEYRKRFYTYVEEFEKAGIFEERQVAYYQGTQAILLAAKSKDKELQDIYKTLGDILVKRSGKFTKVLE